MERHHRLNAAITRRLMNLWPPLFFNGIQITHLSNDFLHCQARLLNRKKTQNVHKTQFGGNLFALTDPIYAMMLNCIFGQKCYVWDQSASIDFIKPGRGTVFIDCHISPEQLAEIQTHIQNGEKYLPEFTIRIFDANNDTVALVKRVVYIRLKKEYRPTV